MISNRINARSASSITTDRMQVNKNQPVMATPASVAVAFGLGVGVAAVVYGVQNGLIG